MRRPIRRQILIPFSLTLAAAVGTIAVSAAWLAARRSEQQSLRELNAILGTLASSPLTYSQSVLEKIHGLSGVELVALDETGRLVYSTLPDTSDALIEKSRRAPLMSVGQSISEFPRVGSGEARFFAARLASDGSANVASLVVLYPEASWREERWAAAWPPLVVGAATLLIVFLISAWLAGRLGRRIGEVEELLSRIANGQFELATTADAQRVSGEATSTEATVVSEPSEPLDELDALSRSASQLMIQLVELQQEIRHTEQVRLLAQLAGGLAHQLRNAVTGARLAIQLHDRRCDLADDESLSVALRQLALTEQQIRSLLSLGRREPREAEPAAVRDLIAEMEQLVTPHANHAHVELSVTCHASEAVVDDAESFRLAALNLALNAIEAAGAGGSVDIGCSPENESVCFEVRDSGTGPPPEIGDSLFDPFVTSRPEGVGLGLVLVRQTADRFGGSVDWHREGDQTVFRLRIPLVRDTTGIPNTSGIESGHRASERRQEPPPADSAADNGDLPMPRPADALES